MAEKYQGQINLQADTLAHNPGSVLNIIDHIKKNFDYNKCATEDEKAAMKETIEVAFKKISRPGYQRQMVFDNFEITHQIGYGSFGKVWKAYGKYTGNVAIKQLPVGVHSYSRILKERDLMIALDHERICKLHGAFFDNDIFLVMEICYGSVANLVKKIDQKNAVRFSVHLLEGLQHMHALNIIHADIKPDNCLISTNNSLVITDFGSAFLLDEETGEDFVEAQESVGSYPYQDIAALKYQKFKKRTDIFAAGCVMFEMDTHEGLLLYPRRDTHPRALYIDALENGRVKDLRPYLEPASGMEREMIMERAIKCSMGFLVEKLIREDSRLTAEEALVDITLNAILACSEVSRKTPSNETVYVTREFNIDTSERFEFLSDSSDSTKMETAFLTFYFDKRDFQASQNILRDTSSGDDDYYNDEGEEDGENNRGEGITDSDPNSSDSSSQPTQCKKRRYNSVFTPYDQMD